MRKKNSRAVRPRVYVCHTYYHVYISFLKELKLLDGREPGAIPGAEKADLILSKMSTDFENLRERADSTGLFGQVVERSEERRVGKRVSASV